MKFGYLAVAAALALGGCSMVRGMWPWTEENPPTTIEAPTVTADAGAFAAFQHAPMTPAALMAHVERLASDEFEGRAPGTRGEELTVDYISRAFAALGLQPGNNGSWTQDVPIATATVTNNPTLRLGEHSYVFGTDFVAWTKRLEPTTSVHDAELVFVGYGIVSAENNWNDYAGVDVRGKVAVILVNDPDFDTGDNRGFGGRAMTYYGRWTYKLEEAARQGAAGAIIVHEDAAAAYGWGTVQSSWSGPQVDLLRADRGASRVAVEGWIQNGVAQLLFQRAGLNFAEERRRAQNPGFTAVSLNQTLSIDLETSITESLSRNVIGVLPGRERPQEAMLYTAHWDHLGRCTPVDGDDICNGALDNATGVAGLIELARRFASEPRTERSIAFISFTAEESGLLGSAYYASHPIFAPTSTAAAINMDGLSTYGMARDITVIGYGQTNLDQMLAEAAAGQRRVVTPDGTPERGSYYRSDHFNLAKIGIPSLYVNTGLDLYVGGTERGRAVSTDYIAQRYHKPDDELRPDWDMTGAMRDLQLLHDVGHRVADSAIWPEWRPSSEFRAIRDASIAVRRY
ncbi:peptidase [alpha proteobacterium U9-1i]|nr:peptidase [alpha proteobacterium U9-1i]